MSDTFLPTFCYKLIYIFSVDLPSHTGCLKIGEATIHTTLDADDLLPNCKDLNNAARERIKAYTNTVGVKANLLYAEIAVLEKETAKGKVVREGFHDKAVHAVLEHSGVAKKVFPGTSADEWYIVDLATAKKAIAAVKAFKPSLTSAEVVHDEPPIQLRDEQQAAVAKTLKRFKSKNDMLWDAKMRFGKTLTSLQVVKEGKFRRVAIITHRPVVGSGWAEDFHKIFRKGDAPYHFIDKSALSSASYDVADQKANDAELARLDASGSAFIYFASIQDLRGSQRVGGKFAKNEGVFNLDWDLVIVDEAHEGTQTNLGETVIREIVKPKTKVLALSGTPFNILDHYEEDAVYVWDYVMEQSCKEHWDEDHPGQPNPYAELPKLNIFTYSLGEKYTGYTEEDLDGKAFNFREFFRTWTGDSDLDGCPIPMGRHVGDFVHQDDVHSFLDLITKSSPTSRYPFSSAENRALFKHTLWMVPGVAAAKALSELLRRHPVFKFFGIANVAGEGDDFEDTKYADALKMVRDTIKANEQSITLSCGKLTTGVTVREWTGVMMLAGSVNTSAASYMQTIFRVQSAGQIDGKQKENAYVFDFAPDRALRVLAETAQLSRKVAKNDPKEEKSKQALREFLNYCPVIAIDGTEMRTYDVPKMMSQLKHIFVVKAIRNGFDDAAIYSDRLMRLGNMDAKKFEMLKRIVGISKQSSRMDSVVVDDEGFDEEKRGNGHVKPKNSFADERRAEREAQAKARKERDHAISILRAISIRMPLLIYGADVPCEEDITLKRFVSLIDDASWEEFMPHGVTKKTFAEFIEYYDETVFVSAGKEIRRLARSADTLAPTARVQQIARIFGYFKNPDKETVLTPWRVVNKHLSDTIGGWCFWDAAFMETLDEPRFTVCESVTKALFCNGGTKVLELNSKSGLYPLYVAYSLYRHKLGHMSEKSIDQGERMKIWKEVIARNLFVVCKTPMAESITHRTLLGYHNGQLNARYYRNIVNVLQRKPQKFVSQVCDGNAWNNKELKMKKIKFDAVVGNPPYQIEGVHEGDRSNPIYHLFMDAAFSLASRVSLITPGRFLFNAGQTPKAWNNKVLNDEHIKVVHYWQKSNEVFPNVDIKGGVAITYRDEDMNFGKIGIYSPFKELNSILHKVMDKECDKPMFDTIVSSQGVFRFSAKFLADNPKIAIELTGKGTGTKIVSKEFETMATVFKESRPAKGEYVEMIGRLGGERVSRFIRRDWLEDSGYLDCYKVFVPEANGTGAIGEVLSTPLIGEPLIGSTDTFISVGRFSASDEAENCMKYIKTRFARTMLGVLKATQHNTKATWRYVPLQDFTGKSDIDWTRSISAIDSQLYAKYGLTKSEQKFIESMIKPME